MKVKGTWGLAYDHRTSTKLLTTGLADIKISRHCPRKY